MTARERILVTAALPYANGSIHIGHLLEYLLTDIYVRALRMAGHDALYICADDTHGTPIVLNAQRAGVSPEDFVARFAEEHIRDFTAFGIRFDSFYSTNAPENRKWVLEIYEKLQAGGHLKRYPLKQLYDEQAKQFLPDRFVKGTCPKCGSPDQYGDVCENCSSTYAPTDLVEPYSVLSGTRPVLRESQHVFVDLSRFEAFLSEWTSTEGRLQPEILRFVRGWLDSGLRDWCISRDAPYFGFEIPGEDKKFFYVWVDAPIGYIASTENWAKLRGRPGLVDEIWREGKARVEHVIGKDIVYFHTLFWPAMLQAAGLTVPSRVHTHGMLTVNGVKMSKSRGTFINAATYLEHLDPLYLRYYFASKIGPSPDDVDLSLEEFVQRVNAELVNTLANLVARGASFLANKLDGRYGRLPPESEAHVKFARDKIEEARAAYRDFDLARAVRAAVDIANLGNKLFQDGAPWKKVANDQEGARRLVTLCLNLARSAVVIVAPAVPEFAVRAYRALGLDGAPRRFEEGTRFDLVERPGGTPERLVERMDKKNLAAVIDASKQEEEPKADPAPAHEVEDLEDEITVDVFGKSDLRVGLVRQAQEVKGAKKLLELRVDLGEGRIRTIFAGVREAYRPEHLVGQKVVVVANLKPRKMRFGVSEGMVLAAGTGGKDLQVVTVPESAALGSRVR